MHALRAVFLSTLLLPGASCGGGDDLSPEEEELVSIINTERSSRGFREVRLRKDLTCAAANHVGDIGERKACSHTGADGSSPGDRVSRCKGSGWSGEIVACGHTTPRAAVDGWLGSEGHREIMLDPDQVSIGVGMHNNYWAAVFDKK